MITGGAERKCPPKEFARIAENRGKTRKLRLRGIPNIAQDVSLILLTTTKEKKPNNPAPSLKKFKLFQSTPAATGDTQHRADTYILPNVSPPVNHVRPDRSAGGGKRRIIC